MTFQLFPDQLKWEADLRAAYAGGAQSVIGVAPTGFGKTVCFSDMSLSASRRGTVGIFVHRAELIDQIGRALAEFGVTFGFMAPGFRPNPLAAVQVCSVQAMARRMDRLLAKPFDFCIIDECHHAAEGSSWHGIINVHKQKKKKVLGVTATPKRLSGEPLSVAFDSMVIGPTVADLIDLGRLSRYTLYAPFRPDMTGVGKRGGDFAREQNAGLMDRPTITGDAVAHYKRLAHGKRALVFCTSVAHAEHVAELFRTHGYRAASIDGSLDKTTRRKIRDDFASGALEIMTSCELVSEGYDVPAIEAVIMLRPTASEALYLQMVGRGLRRFPGKDRAIILDHAGNSALKIDGGRGHGLPDDPREWSLGGESGKAKAARAYPSVTCGRCWATFRPAPCCPICGFERDIHGREIAQIDGDLVEIDPDLVREARRLEQEALNRRVQQTRGLDNLADLAIETGRNAGWIFHLHKSRKGGNPNLTYTAAMKAFNSAKNRAKATT